MTLGPLGLKPEETLLDIMRKGKTDPKRQTPMANHVKKQEKYCSTNLGGGSSTQVGFKSTSL